MRIFTISDIHGCLQSFNSLLEQLQLQHDDKIFFLGDYIDRGPNSKGVIDRIMKLKANGYEVECLLGNHEYYMMDARSNRSSYLQWLQWGGQQTMDSFLANDLSEIEPMYWQFLSDLKYYREFQHYILVHAGLNFDLPNPFEGEHSLIWIRNWYEDINYKWLGDRIIIHGHTPTPLTRIQDMVKFRAHFQVVNIDGGCYAKHMREMGHLCALELTSNRLYVQKNIDDMSSYSAV